MKAFKSKQFKDADVQVPYITWNNVSPDIKYKLFNNQVEIDFKSIIDRVLEDAGISGFDTDQVLFTIPYNIENTSSGDTFTLLIDKRRFHIRLPEHQIVSNKQQKIDWDNTHPHRWSLSQWVKFFEKLWWDHYGFNSVELDLRGKEGSIRRGKFVNRLKLLLSKLKTLNVKEQDIVNYIVWVFSNKASKVSLGMPLICCDGYIQEWMVWNKKNVVKKGLSKKWK